MLLTNRSAAEISVRPTGHLLYLFFANIIFGEESAARLLLFYVKKLPKSLAVWYLLLIFAYEFKGLSK